MKVIGRAGEESYNGKFLVEATEREIEQLMGIYYERDKKTPVKIGLVFDVDAMFSKLYWLKNRGRSFDELTRKLREVADIVDDSRPMFKEVLADDGGES